MNGDSDSRSALTAKGKGLNLNPCEMTQIRNHRASPQVDVMEYTEFSLTFLRYYWGAMPGMERTDGIRWIKAIAGLAPALLVGLENHFLTPHLVEIVVTNRC
jgi:hypothetical protein